MSPICDSRSASGEGEGRVLGQWGSLDLGSLGNFFCFTLSIENAAVD